MGELRVELVDEGPLRVVQNEVHWLVWMSGQLEEACFKAMAVDMAKLRSSSLLSGGWLIDLAEIWEVDIFGSINVGECAVELLSAFGIHDVSAKAHLLAPHLGRKSSKLVRLSNLRESQEVVGLHFLLLEGISCAWVVL